MLKPLLPLVCKTIHKLRHAVAVVLVIAVKGAVVDGLLILC
jgi:hypothetical protein